MNWEQELTDAELLLHSAVTPSSERIISAIKRVNPTRLCLDDPDKKQGYRLKNKLQNLLLENYGEAFQLIPHPCCPNVVLIKHLFLPSVDACHADVGALSAGALDAVSDTGTAVTENEAKPKARPKKPGAAALALSPRESLKRAQQFLSHYDYPDAELELAGMRAGKSGDLPALSSGIRMLYQDMGAYQTAIDTLLAQPGHVLKDKGIRELLALAYHGNDMPAEAGAVFDSLHPSDLGKEGLYAYARLSFNDGNAAFAQHLVRLAEAKDGLVAGLDDLRREIEQVLSRHAEPVLQQAEDAFSRGEWDQALTLSRKALEKSLNLPKARRIIALVEAQKGQAEVTALWQAFERSGNHKERLRLLARLLEQDKSSRARIEALIQVEKGKEKREMIEQRLGALEQALRDEKWPDCFEAIMWLLRQKDAAPVHRGVISKSPLFAVLYRNGHLERMSRHDAKEAWLTYVEAKAQLEAGRDREAFPLLRKVRPVFRASPCFGSEYQRVLTAQRTAAAEEADRMLAEVRAGALDYQEALARCNAAHAAVDILPERERDAFANAIEELLEQLKPHKDGEALLEEYRQAVMTGQSARATSLRELVADPAAVAAIDAEINILMRIDAEPVALSFSPDMEVDLARENPGLEVVGTTDRHIFLRDTETSVIVIDFVDMTAWRLHSEKFPGMTMVDAIVDRHLFLFRERDTNRYWRAIMRGGESRFTAVLDFSSSLSLPESIKVIRAFLSSSKETEYFYVLKNSDKDKVVSMGRMIIGLGRNSGPECNLRTEEIGGIVRASSDPDNFVIGTAKDMWMSSRNLRIPGRFPIPWQVFRIDPRNRLIYLVDSPRLKACDFKWGLVKDYLRSISIGMSYGNSVRGICPETSTLLMSYKKGRGVFYNLETNEFTSQVSLSAFICTDVPSTWYYMEYSENTSSIRIKDITRELADLLKWEEIISMDNLKKIPQEVLLDPLRRMLEGEDVVGQANSSTAPHEIGTMAEELDNI